MQKDARVVTLRRQASRWATALFLGISVGANASAAQPACDPRADGLAIKHLGMSITMHKQKTAPTCPTLDQSLLADIQSVLTAGGVVFLGEAHDNVRHHAFRADLIRLIELPRPPAVVFEHIRVDQMEALRALPQPLTRDALIQALEWSKSGWPDAAIFAPLFDAVIEKKMPILAGEPMRARVREAAQKGIDAFQPDELARLGLNRKRPEKNVDALLSELEASHCGLMPKSAFANMAVAQHYRDATLAIAALEGVRDHGSAIVLTGNGHANVERGAPEALQHLSKGRPSLSIALQETGTGKTWGGATDMTLMTKPAERKDPCEEMRARFGKKG